MYNSSLCCSVFMASISTNVILNRARSVDKLVPFILERVTSVGVSFKFSKLSAIAGVVYVQKYYMRGEGTFGA
jgi:hypothetical protein